MYCKKAGTRLKLNLYASRSAKNCVWSGGYRLSTLPRIEISSLLLWISERWQQCVAHAWVECDVTLNLSGLLQSWVEWNSTSSHSYLLMTFMHDWSWKFTSNNFRAAARIDKSDESPHSPIEQLCPNTVVPADTMSIWSIQIGGSDSHIKSQPWSTSIERHYRLIFLTINLFTSRDSLSNSSIYTQVLKFVKK